jgi:cob(I)alamin adenosyltransferase
MSKYYSRTGDEGTSGRLGGGCVHKDDPLLEAIGTIDEVNSAFGIARAICKHGRTRDIITVIQKDLYHLMAEISATPDKAPNYRVIDNERVRWLEEQTASIGETFEMPTEFIIPGDTLSGGILDLARTIIRRAERRVSTLFRLGNLENKDILRYLNRLSSLCFVLELWEIIVEKNSNISFVNKQDQ